MADFTQLPFLGCLMDEPRGDLQRFLMGFLTGHALTVFPCTSPLPLPFPGAAHQESHLDLGCLRLQPPLGPVASPASHSSLAASESHLLLAGVSFLLLFLGLDAVCWADPLLEGISTPQPRGSQQIVC